MCIVYHRIPIFVVFLLLLLLFCVGCGLVVRQELCRCQNSDFNNNDIFIIMVIVYSSAITLWNQYNEILLVTYSDIVSSAKLLLLLL